MDAGTRKLDKIDRLTFRNFRDPKSLGKAELVRLMEHYRSLSEFHIKKNSELCGIISKQDEEIKALKYFVSHYGRA